MGLGKFWPDLKISEAFLMGLKMSVFRVILLLGVSIFLKSRCRILKPGSRSLEILEFTILYPQ